MIWLSWRLQRTEIVLLGAIALALAATLALAHSDVATRARILSLPSCLSPSSGDETNCWFRGGALARAVETWIYAFNFLPLIAALLLALPFVTELESGVYRLAWTQSVTRKRWVWTKLAMLTLSGLTFASLLAIAFSWWSAPMNKIEGRLGTDWYDLTGLVPISYTLFAVGLVIALGTMIRRPIPAFVLSTVLFLAARIPFITLVRPRLLTPLTRQVDFNTHTNDWGISPFWVDGSGKQYSVAQVQAMCGAGPQRPGALSRDCIVQHGLNQFERYQPDSRYWSFQLMETGIFAVAGLALLGFAAWYLLRRFE